MHIIKQQSDYLKGALQSLPSIDESNVFVERLIELQDRELPALLLNFKGESVSIGEGSNRYHPIQDRDSSWQIAVAVKLPANGEELQDTLLGYYSDLELRLSNTAEDPNSPFYSVRLVSANIETSAESALPIGLLIVNILAKSKTRFGEAQTMIF